MRESSDLWESGVFTLTLAALLISILLAIHRAEKRRAFWLGFALFGWIYLGLSLVPSIESRLITTKALAYLDSKVPGRSVIDHLLSSSLRIRGALRLRVSRSHRDRELKLRRQHGSGRGLWDATTGKLLGGWSGTTENFVRIGHSLFALLVGWFGGQLSRRLCRTSRSSEPSTVVDAEGTNS